LDIPAKVIEATVINLSSLVRSVDLQLKVYNRYLSELHLNLSGDSVEYGLHLLTQLRTIFPALDFVKVVYFCALPKRKKLLIRLENKELHKFAVDLKKDEVGIQRFSKMFDEHVFKVYPVMHFDVDVIYQQGTLISKELVSYSRISAQ
jgi:hypothetical protein